MASRYRKSGPRKHHVKLVGDPWTDDHILCCKVELDGEEIELLWCGWEGVAAAMYADESPRAMIELLRLVAEQKEANKEVEGV